MSGILLDKVVIVTGAGSGIGEAAALLFAAEGARVLVADINADTATRTVRSIEHSGGKASPFTVDVSREPEVQAMVAAAVEIFGRLDGAFNNAGIGPTQKPAAEVEEADWQRVIAVNLTGAFLCTKHEIRAMLSSGGGAIVNMASTAGLFGVPFQTAYSASKHGIIGLTKTVATEYAKQGIRANAVCPSATDTPSLRALGIDVNSLVPTPMGRAARPDEVAQLACWLLCDRSSYITGQTHVIDGGKTSTSFIPQ